MAAEDSPADTLASAAGSPAGRDSQVDTPASAVGSLAAEDNPADNPASAAGSQEVAHNPEAAAEWHRGALAAEGFAEFLAARDS